MKPEIINAARILSLDLFIKKPINLKKLTEVGQNQLIGSINQDIPQTSYLKCVDVWFIWYNSNIFIITCFHVVMEYLFHRENIQKNAVAKNKPLKCNPQVVSVVSSGVIASFSVLEKTRASNEEIINYLAAVILLVATAIFNVLYFSISF